MYVCGVCSFPIHSHPSYAQHLRGRPDTQHVEARNRYDEWLEIHLTTYKCAKCKGWYRREAYDHRSGPGRCPPCTHLQQVLPKRAYEALTPEPCGGRVGWESLVTHQEVWTPNETLCNEVRRMLQGGERARDAMSRLGLTFNMLKSVGEYTVGVETYAEWAAGRKRAKAAKVGRDHADWYRSLSPEQKAAVLQQRFPRTVRTKIEVAMTNALTALGEAGFMVNQWQSLTVSGERVPREADIKLPVDGTRKLVILCDGEAFHGPKCIFGNPQDRIRDDVETAQAYFDAGYSILRYSGTEILSGSAQPHLAGALARLRSGTGRVMRTWHPNVETWA